MVLYGYQRQVSSTYFQYQATMAGIDNYLIKPLSLRVLKTLINII